MPGSRDIALISLGTTPGLRRADAAFVEAAEAAGVSCELVPVPVGMTGKLRRQITLTDLVEAAAARRAARPVDARVLVFSAVTSALLAHPQRPYALRFDSPAALNRPGLTGAWQRRAELAAMRGAVALLPWGEAAAAAVPPVAHGRPTVALHVPIEIASTASGPRDVDALTYAGYPQKRGLDILIRAWGAADAGAGERRLVVAGIDRARGEAWLRERGIAVPAGVEWRALLPRSDWDALLGRTQIFVNASRREDHGLSQLEALAAGALLVTVPSDGPYEALPIARRLDPRLVARDSTPEALGETLAAAFATDREDYAARAAAALAPYRRDAVQRVFEHDVLPALGLR